MPGQSGLLRIGTVGRAHGVRGEVKVIPETDDPERLEHLETLYVGPSNDDAQPLKVERFRYQHSRKGLTLLLKFSGFDSPEDAATLRRHGVMVRDDDFPLDEDEVLAADLLGFQVVSLEGDALGEITTVLDMPAQIVYEVTRENGSVALVPAVAEFVRQIDVEARRVTMTPIEGLFE